MTKHIAEVIESIGPKIQHIVIVDDKCPENTGDFVKKKIQDERVSIIAHTENQGVGGAMITGYKEALNLGCEIVVKIDGDGQMDTSYLNKLLKPILEKRADYTKGNRFYHLEELRKMPKIRLLGNAALSIITKFCSGYWTISDPTNGYTAIHKRALERLSTKKLSKDYFFESDLLAHLYLINAVALDIPIPAKYGDETSNLKIYKIINYFVYRNLKNFLKRIVLNYYIRDFSLASLQLVLGLCFCISGASFGAVAWIHNFQSNTTASAGTVMLAALPLLFGFHLLMSFISHDLKAEPNVPLQIET